ncbi:MULTISPECIES: LacI family DNA-binding transcriptional regulator [unclassified Arthrobacter]|uniref:LacI family DNA-binding transcriptional regulator n=1 Tax=unclassified Arthrobacter TaxID=235627 RepID=UPI002E0BFC4C|nr:MULTISPECIES: LacI family DNA-binding transcriptional regulator [unclassified Arthrobacter]MEC5192526.1 LacI family repressor for deo operon, udp, cdd, tsx, nupC, and nupG [Arthrobacter sp. MP_M4]MEC5204010.1 LacI family repressor for deo operon, udp, cdd, tsx, nupC, and nupG [Arthrobacter sp. MP_M7]
MARTSDRAQRGGHSGVSIEDVAAAAGVSTATVSRAVRGLPRVSPATREKILVIADDLGYVASSSASGLATGRTKTIGVLAPFVSRWFFSKAIEGADRELHARRYNLSLFNLGGHGSNRERLFSKTMVYKQIDALLVLCMALTHEEIEHLQKIDIPLVVVGGHVEECPYIGIDDYAAAATAVRHLIGLGHQDIALLHGDDETDLNFDVPRVRIEAFKDIMAESGLRVREEWDELGDFTVRSGQEAFRRLWNKPGPKPTAIFCASDEMAMGVILEAARAGVRIPDDLSVIGIDDHDFSEAMGLTTVGQRPDEQAELGTKMLLDELDGIVGSVRSVVAPHQLIVRSTTAPPRRAGAPVSAASASI